MSAASSRLMRGGARRRDSDSESFTDLPRTRSVNFKPRYASGPAYQPDDDEFSIITNQHSRIVKTWFDGYNIPLPSDSHREYLFKKDETERNLIHRALVELRKRTKENTNKRLPPPALPQEALDDIESLLLQKPELLTEQDASDLVPMYEALKLNASLLFRIINLLIPAEVVQVLQKIKVRCDKGQEAFCPLWRVSKGRRRQCLKEKGSSKKGESDDRNGQRERADDNAMVPVVKSENVGDLENGGRCLHDVVDAARVLEEDRRLRELIENALKYKAHTLCLQPLLTSNNFDPGQKDNPDIIPLSGFRTLLNLCPDDAFKQKLESGHTPLQRAVKLYEDQSIDYELLFSVIECLVERCPDSIFIKTTVGDIEKTAYRLLKELKRGETDHNTLWRSRAEDLFKRKCIGFPRKTWDEKKEFLYWDTQSQRRLHLNLMGESITISKRYIEIMHEQSGIIFETVLEFVKLPYWNPEMTSPAKLATERISQVSQEIQTGREDWQEKAESDPYTAIFDWLWEYKVQKIFTVEVDDDGPEPHTNAAIRKALRGNSKEGSMTRDFNVKVWKWKKFDICCDTVAIAAPSAREVHLYSHGNTAVLRGWACGSSLAKMTKLEKLLVEIHPWNVNDMQDCKSYERDFKSSIRKQCPLINPNNISVKYHGTLAGQDDQNNPQSNNKSKQGDEDEKQHQNAELIPNSGEWIKGLDEFKEFMINLRLAEKLPVKVALLDDGARLQGLDGVQQGESFRPDKEEFFVGPCSHGTKMAHCIREVCPMAQLYIARLDDSRRVENQKFTIESCHKALEWAWSMEVDIISMSWTFERQDDMRDDDHEERFIRLVRQIVASQKVLLFASLPDKGPSFETPKVIPVSLEGVIKIGSATVYGETAPENLYEKPNFILPGENATQLPGETDRGSSFATAYAAGLAAMVLHCLEAHKELSDCMTDEYAAKALDKARTTDGMKIIFNNLSRRKDNNKNENGAFVQPHHVFGRKFHDSRHEKLQTLSRIRNMILPSNILQSFYK